MSNDLNQSLIEPASRSDNVQQQRQQTEQQLPGSPVGVYPPALNTAAEAQADAAATFKGRVVPEAKALSRSVPKVAPRPLGAMDSDADDPVAAFADLMGEVMSASVRPLW